MLSRLVSSERAQFALLFLALAVVLALAVTRARGLPPFQARPTESTPALAGR